MDDSRMVCGLKILYRYIDVTKMVGLDDPIIDGVSTDYEVSEEDILKLIKLGWYQPQYETEGVIFQPFHYHPFLPWIFNRTHAI